MRPASASSFSSIAASIARNEAEFERRRVALRAARRSATCACPSGRPADARRDSTCRPSAALRRFACAPSADGARPLRRRAESGSDACRACFARRASQRRDSSDSFLVLSGNAGPPESSPRRKSLGDSRARAVAKRQVRRLSAAARIKARNGERRPLPALDDGPEGAPIQVGDCSGRHGMAAARERRRFTRRASPTTVRRPRRSTGSARGSTWRYPRRRDRTRRAAWPDRRDR